MAETSIKWIFDELPPSGARRGGDPSAHAFRHELDTFVREVVQNANDQALERPAIDMTFIELRDDALAEFQRAIAWDSLLPHLRAPAASHGGRELSRQLEEVERSRRLLLLRIEDRNTVGLTGDESGGDSHFTALCKDTLYSHKQTEAAGGSYGLGKSVLWRFSALSTVLFCSVLGEDPPGRRQHCIRSDSMALASESHRPQKIGLCCSGLAGRLRVRVARKTKQDPQLALFSPSTTPRSPSPISRPACQPRLPAQIPAFSDARLTRPDSRRTVVGRSARRADPAGRLRRSTAWPPSGSTARSC